MTGSSCSSGFHCIYSSSSSECPSFTYGDHIAILLKVEEFPGVGEVNEDEEEVKEESADFTFAKVCFVSYQSCYFQ